MKAKIALVLACASSLSLGSAELARADSREGTVATARSVYVVGRDQFIEAAGTVPPDCSGSSVQVGLYVRGGAAKVNQVDTSVAPATAIVAPGGIVTAAIPLPTKLNDGVKTLWIGITGACLAKPLVSLDPTGLLLSEVSSDPRDGGAATFVVPRRAVEQSTNVPGRGTIGESVGALVVLVEGVKCTTASLGDPATKDAAGDIRIRVGGADQPAACSLEGSRVSFVNQAGQELFQHRTLIPGVVQPFANLAPDMGPSTAAGAGPRDTTESALPGVLLLVVAGAATLGAVARRRQTHGSTDPRRIIG